MSAYTDADVQALAEALRSDYDSEFCAAHLRWQDFAEQASMLLDAVAPAIAARALREAAAAYESHARDTFWRDDSPFHASGRFHGELAAEWMQKRADEIERATP